jgi:hypothetical protein
MAARGLPSQPATYEVDALRALMLAGGPFDYGVPLDPAVLAGVADRRGGPDVCRMEF